MTAPVRVMIVDDQSVFRRAARKLLATVEGFEMVGEATTGEEALRLVAPLDAELVLMDVRMPGMGGLEATRRILADRPDTRIVLLSSSDVSGLADEMATCGAERFVLKADLEAATLEGLLPSG